jgi:predicted nucleic acid-binding protein
VTYLIDTNIISEIRKTTRCDRNVAAWYAAVDGAELYLSVLVTGEIRRGVELARRRDAAKAAVLERWLDEVDVAFEERILPVDRAVADAWGRMNARRPISAVDGLLAATALVHDLTLVTRNDADVAGLGSRVLNPFKPRRA